MRRRSTNYFSSKYQTGKYGPQEWAAFRKTLPALSDRVLSEAIGEMMRERTARIASRVDSGTLSPSRGLLSVRALGRRAVGAA
jgi:hypothetical protein